jgi:hypothetical protein
MLQFNWGFEAKGKTSKIIRSIAFITIGVFLIVISIII